MSVIPLIGVLAAVAPRSVRVVIGPSLPGARERSR